MEYFYGNEIIKRERERGGNKSEKPKENQEGTLKKKFFKFNPSHNNLQFYEIVFLASI